MLWGGYSVTVLLLSIACCGDATLSCRNVMTSLRKMKLGQLQRKDFITKPILGRTAEYCSDLELTCCSQQMEQKLSINANRNFKQDFGYFVMQESKFCGNMEVQLTDAVQEAFKNSFGAIIREVNSKYVNGLLAPLFKYLLSFNETTDLCKLPEIIDTQLQRIARYVLNYQSDSNCLKTIIQPYYATFERSILELLEPLLGRLKLLLSGVKYKRRLTEFMSTYQASPHCAKQLMGMTFCSTCSGLTAQPCHSLCLNTIQGCLIDMADVYWSIKDMLKILNRIQDQLNFNVRMEQVSMKLRVYIVQLNKQSTTIRQKLKESNCLLIDSKRSTDVFSSDIYNQRSLQGTSKLMESISDELKCFQHQLVKISSIPEQMCTRRYLTQRSNIGCWTGSSYGTYTAPVADFSRQAVQQNKNPEFLNSSLPNTHELNLNIIQFTQHLHDTFNDDIRCDNDDDEDCTRFAYIASSNCEVMEFSGSGNIVNEIMEPKRGNSVTIKVPTGATIKTFPTLPPSKLPDNVTNLNPSISINTNNVSMSTNNTVIDRDSGSFTIHACLLIIMVMVALAIY